MFRYVEEAMTEIPMNSVSTEEHHTTAPVQATETNKRRTLRPKAKASPESSPANNGKTLKPITDDESKDPVYAISRSRGAVTKHTLGQAASGIPWIHGPPSAVRALPKEM